MCTPSIIHNTGKHVHSLTLFVLFPASDNRVQHPSWTVVSDGLPKDHTCGGKIFSPHVSDCHKYYLCQFGVLIEQTCPAGLYWNKVNCKLIDNKLPVVAVIGRNDGRSVSYQVSHCVSTSVGKDHMPVQTQSKGGSRAVTHLQRANRRRW
jgi:hypothetical protein